MTGPKINLTLQTVTLTTNNAGNFTESWATVKTIKGSLTLTAERDTREKFFTDRNIVKSTHRFMFDYYQLLGSSITEADRFYDSVNSDYYEILFINNIANKNRFYSVDLRKVE